MFGKNCKPNFLPEITQSLLLNHQEHVHVHTHTHTYTSKDHAVK